MPLAEELQERERQAGNTPDSLNSGQSHFDKTVTKGGDSGTYIDTHGDAVQENYNADTPDNDDTIAEQEETGQDTPKDSLYKSTGSFNGGRFNPRRLLGKKAAPAGIVGLILAGFGGVTILFGGPGTMFAAMLATFGNANNFAAPASNYRGLVVLGNRLAKTGVDLKQFACRSVTSIPCKSTTMSEKFIKKLQAANIDVYIDTGSGEPVKFDEKTKQRGILGTDRFRVPKITVPSGEFDLHGNERRVEIKGGTDLNLLLKNNEHLRNALYKGYNPLVASFFDSNFVNMLKKGFKATKGTAKKFSSEKEATQDLNNTLDEAKQPVDENGRLTEDQRKATAEANKSSSFRENILKASNGNIAQIGIGAACGLYKAARISLALAKAQQITKIGQFFATHAGIFESFRAGQGDYYQGISEGDIFQYSSKSPTPLEPDEKDTGATVSRYYNTTWSDAEGAKIALYGQFVNFVGWARKWIVGGSDLMAKVDAGVRTVESARVGGWSVREGLCKYFSSAGPCTVEGAVKPGPIWTKVAQAGVCVTITGIVSAALMPVVAKGIKLFTNDIIKMMDDLDISSDTRGIDAGNVFAAGAGLVLGRMAQQRGLLPATVAAAAEYRAQTAGEQEQIARLYRYQARDTPFDVTNQYSFLGSIAQGLYKSGGSSNSILGDISRFIGIVPLAITTFTNTATAGAASGQGWQMAWNNFDKNIYVDSKGENTCPDKSLTVDALIDADPQCVPQFSMPTESLYGISSEDNQKFMFGDDLKGKYADPETGKPLGEISDTSSNILDDLSIGLTAWLRHPDDDDPGHKYAMYVTYCANRDQNEQGPYGDTMLDRDFGSKADVYWWTGTFCHVARDDSSSAYSGNPEKAAVFKDIQGMGDEAPSRKELDNFALFTMEWGDGGINRTMDEDTTDSLSNTIATGMVATGECSALAKKLLDSPNVGFQLPVQRGYMEQTAKDCTQTLDCSGKATMSTKLLGLLVSASEKYKITIGAQAAGHECDGGYHPKGQAVDINGVRRLSDPAQTKIDWTPTDASVLDEFYQFLDRTAGASGMKLELGQKQCFQQKLGKPAPVLGNTRFVDDVCNHVHVGVTSP